MVNFSERSFEEAIECGRLQQARDACAGEEDYDRALCMLSRDGVDFVLATQPKELKKRAECLKELRTALISAAVTGQLDVREEVLS